VLDGVAQGRVMVVPWEMWWLNRRCHGTIEDVDAQLETWWLNGIHECSMGNVFKSGVSPTYSTMDSHFSDTFLHSQNIRKILEVV
jgi:hypothetical protein